MKLSNILEAILSEVNVQDVVDRYIRSTKYDIENSLGNCSFFTRDFLNWAKENNVKASYVYMPQAKEYREKNNISDSDWEDHIAPMVNNTIIDFAYTPKGVSKKVRTKNTVPPRLFSNTDDLFKPDGAYGKYGYYTREVNKQYGKPVDVNTMKVLEPSKKGK